MKTNILSLAIAVLVAGVLTGCTTQNFSPGPNGPIGPQGNPGPDGDIAAASGDTIVIESEGNLVSAEHAFTDFDAVEVNALMTVEITLGESYEIITEVEEDAVPYLQVLIEGGRLRIGLDPSLGYSTNNAALFAKITLPSLRSLVVDGASHVILEDIQCTRALDIEVTGTSSLDGQIYGCDLSLEVSDVSTVSLAGSVPSAVVSISGVSSVDLSALEAQNLDYEVDQLSELVLNEN
jgi:hypothetical protein